jgi:hypothetical protein
MSKATIKATFILFTLLLSASAQPQLLIGKVVGVSDGDTITVLDKQKRRDCERSRRETSDHGRWPDNRQPQRQDLPPAELPGLQQGVGEEPHAIQDRGRSAGRRVQEGAELSLRIGR